MSMPTMGSISDFARDHCSARNAEFSAIHSFGTAISPLTPAASLIMSTLAVIAANTFCINIAGIDETTADSTMQIMTIGIRTG